MLLRPLCQSFVIHQPLRAALSFGRSLGAGRHLLRRDPMSPPLGELKTMKVYDDRFKSIITPEMKILEDLFVKNGYEIRIAGGAVRDFMMGQNPHDFDFATTATPEEMKTIFSTEGIRMLNLGGEKHGTITARINDKENFEVTTLRIDVVTDGRRAEVEFTTDWQIDANRRDLTVNAMFLSFDGTLYDYFRGLEHLKERKVLFVGDPERRIQEDYLRILRYFRFYGRLAPDENGHDAKTLEAIRLNAGGLQGVSGERLLVELKKILEGRLSCSLICLMHELGVTPFLGFPANLDMAEFKRVSQLPEHLTPSPMGRLAALLHSEEEVAELHTRLRFSNNDRNNLLFVVRYRDPGMTNADDLHFYQTLQFTCNIKGGTPVDVRRWTEDLLKYLGKESILRDFIKWEIPRFPVSGSKLMESGVRKGPQVGKVMARLREIWFESGFTMSENELICKVKEILREISPKRKA